MLVDVVTRGFELGMGASFDGDVSFIIRIEQVVDVHDATAYCAGWTVINPASVLVCISESVA